MISQDIGVFIFETDNGSTRYGSYAICSESLYSLKHRIAVASNGTTYACLSYPGDKKTFRTFETFQTKLKGAAVSG